MYRRILLHQYLTDALVELTEVALEIIATVFHVVTNVGTHLPK